MTRTHQQPAPVPDRLGRLHGGRTPDRRRRRGGHGRAPAAARRRRCGSAWCQMMPAPSATTAASATRWSRSTNGCRPGPAGCITPSASAPRPNRLQCAAPGVRARSARCRVGRGLTGSTAQNDHVEQRPEPVGDQQHDERRSGPATVGSRRCSARPAATPATILSSRSRQSRRYRRRRRAGHRTGGATCRGSSAEPCWLVENVSEFGCGLVLVCRSSHVRGRRDQGISPDLVAAPNPGSAQGPHPRRLGPAGSTIDSMTDDRPAPARHRRGCDRHRSRRRRAARRHDHRPASARTPGPPSRAAPRRTAPAPSRRR